MILRLEFFFVKNADMAFAMAGLGAMPLNGSYGADS